MRSYSKSELFDLERRFQGTKLASENWEIKLDPDKYNHFFVRVKGPFGEFQDLEEVIHKRPYQRLLDPPNDPEPQDNTITIHHVKSERIEIIELSPAQISYLTIYDSLALPISFPWTSNEKEFITHILRITFSDFTNHRIIESPET